MANAGLAPVIPVIMLLAAALFLSPGRGLLSARYWGVLAVAVVAGVAVTIPSLDRAPAGRAFWPWGPPTLFGEPLAFRLGDMAALFVWAVCLLSLSWALSFWHDEETARQEMPLSAPALGLSAVALLLLLSANWPTLVAAAILFDVTMFLRLARPQATDDTARRFLAIILLSDLALVATAYLSRLYPAGEALWTIPSVAEMEVGGEREILPVIAGGLLALAALLRLGVYPLDGWLRSVRAEDGPGERLALLIYRSVGLYLWLVAAAQGILPGPWGTPIMIVAALSMMATAILIWQTETCREGLVYLPSFLASQVVLAALLTGQSGLGVILVLSGNLLLSSAVLSLGTGGVGLKRPAIFLSLPVILAAVSLVGLPLTPGFIGRAALYRLALGQGNVWLIFAMLLGETLVFNALWRWLGPGDRPAEQPTGKPFPFLLRPVASYLPALSLLLLGTLGDFVGEGGGVALPGLAGTFQALDPLLLMALLLPFPLAYWLERQQVFARSLGGKLRRVVEVTLRLDWAGRALADSLSRAGKAAMLLWNVLEGEHYLGWGLVAALIVLLFLVS